MVLWMGSQNICRQGLKNSNFALLFRKRPIRRPLRLSVRTADFHSVKRGSIPLGAAFFRAHNTKCVMSSFSFFFSGKKNQKPRNPKNSLISSSISLVSGFAFSLNRISISISCLCLLPIDPCHCMK